MLLSPFSSFSCGGYDVLSAHSTAPLPKLRQENPRQSPRDPPTAATMLFRS